MFWLWLIFFFCTKLFLIPVALITWTVILEYLAKKFKQKANLEPFFWRVEGCAIYTCAKILINKSSSFSELATSCILALTVPGLKWLVHSIILQLASCNSNSWVTMQLIEYPPWRKAHAYVPYDNWYHLQWLQYSQINKGGKLWFSCLTVKDRNVLWHFKKCEPQKKSHSSLEITRSKLLFLSFDQCFEKMCDPVSC